MARAPRQRGRAPTAIRRSAGASGRTSASRCAIDGDGLATPIVWGDRIYVLSARSLDGAGEGARPAPDASGTPLARQRFLVTAYDRHDGSVEWQRVAVERVPHEGHHQESGWATASPVTDGERALRPLRLGRHLRLHARRRAGLEGRPRRHDHAPRLRRGQLPRALGRHPGGQLGPRGGLLRGRPRRAHRQGAVAEGPARGADLLVDAPHPGARGPGARDRRRRRAHPRLRHPKRARCCGASPAWA